MEKYINLFTYEFSNLKLKIISSGNSYYNSILSLSIFCIAILEHNITLSYWITVKFHEKYIKLFFPEYL